MKKLIVLFIDYYFHLILYKLGKVCKKQNRNNGFKIGDKVRVTRFAYNASNVLSLEEYKTLPQKGVYSLENWDELIFTIAGEYKPTTFEFDPYIYGAYPLKYNSKLIGYVYNSALKHC
jgi:hypothetical protein